MTTIIIGLGNPGAKFEATRHNVGFMALNEFAKKNDFPEFKLQKKFEALVSEGIIGENKIILAEPQTFMNESGKAVQKILKSMPDANLIVVHDDIDMPAGKIKIVEERGSAGHKGVESIIKSVGNQGLIRFRIGIAGQADTKAKEVVLKKFSAEEQKTINETVVRVAEALNFFLENGLEKTMNTYN